MASLASPELARRLRHFEQRIAASRATIAGMPVALQLSAHRTHRNALRIALDRLVDEVNEHAAKLASGSAQRLRIEQVAYELAVLRLDDTVLDTRARQTRGLKKMTEFEGASRRLQTMVGHWAEVLEDPMALLRSQRPREA